VFEPVPIPTPGGLLAVIVNFIVEFAVSNIIFPDQMPLLKFEVVFVPVDWTVIVPDDAANVTVPLKLGFIFP